MQKHPMLFAPLRLQHRDDFRTGHWSRFQRNRGSARFAVAVVSATDRHALSLRWGSPLGGLHLRRADSTQ